MNLPVQAGILGEVPQVARYLLFSLAESDAAPRALQRLAPLVDGTRTVIGLGSGLVHALGRPVPGLREFPHWTEAQVALPATPVALVAWLRAAGSEDAGDLLHRARALEHALVPAFRLDRVLDGFRHGRGPNGHGRDLTGYEDGTENPDGEAALAAAVLQGAGPGLDGSSFVAMQQWVHDFEAFDRLAPDARDALMGRRRDDNAEIEDAPDSAHVKRTAQEDFEPEAFVLRRSMPWALGHQAGLMFVAFGRSLDAFEAQLHRMAGLDDGVVDALFGISRPVSGFYAWCPPVRHGGLDLRGIGL